MELGIVQQVQNPSDNTRDYHVANNINNNDKIVTDKYNGETELGQASPFVNSNQDEIFISLNNEENSNKNPLEYQDEAESTGFELNRPYSSHEGVSLSEKNSEPKNLNSSVSGKNEASSGNESFFVKNDPLSEKQLSFIESFENLANDFSKLNYEKSTFDSAEEYEKYQKVRYNNAKGQVNSHYDLGVTTADTSNSINIVNAARELQVSGDNFMNTYKENRNYWEL